MSEFPPLHDYSRSRAVVMGTWDYQAKGLLSLPAARRSLDRMVGLLTGPLCGWPEDRVTVLRNRDRPGDIQDELIRHFSDVKDVALFYFVGHGQIDPQDQLCLGLTETVTVPARRASTSLEFDDVRKALVGSDAATKIVILDCCFAGLATRRDNTLAATVDVMDMTRATGAYTMAATRQFTTALFETDTPKPQTYFTKYLVDTVEAGIPSEPGGLRLHSLYGEVEEALVRDKRPTPQNRVIDNARDFVFAHNVNPVPAPTPAVDEDDERDYLRRRLDELAETIKTIADAVTVRPPTEPVAAEPAPEPVAPKSPVVLVRAAPVAPEPVESTAAADAAAEQERDQLRVRISQLEKAVLTLKQAVPEERPEVAAAAEATVPPEAHPTVTTPPAAAEPEVREVRETVPPVTEPPVAEAPKPAVPQSAPPKAAATKAAQPTPTPSKTVPPPTSPTKTAAGRTPTAGPQPVKAAAGQTGTGGTPLSRPKPVKATAKRKPQAKQKPQPKKTATSPGQAHPPSQAQPQPQPQAQAQAHTQAPAAAPMPGPRAAPATTVGQKPLADFFADFADEVAAASVDPGPESDPGSASTSGSGAGTRTEEQATTTSGTRTDRADRTQPSDLDKFFELFTEEISRRRLGTTPDD